MPLAIVDGRVIFPDVEQPKNKLDAAEFEMLVRTHMENVPGTKQLEVEAATLQRDGYLERPLAQFIIHVCDWGGCYGDIIKHDVLDKNKKDPIHEIRDHFIKAGNALAQTPPDVSQALREITQINGRGPSFGSKHLRFLCPHLCPVLDSILSANLRYPLNESGYTQFSDDSLAVAKMLEEQGVRNPMRKKGGWFAAEIDMALFALHMISIKKWEPAIPPKKTG
jgi:hypothetical protein